MATSCRRKQRAFVPCATRLKGRKIAMAEKKPVVETVKTDVQTMIDALVEKAQVALKEFMALDQEAVDNIVHAMALAGLDKHQELARMAVEETGESTWSLSPTASPNSRSKIR